MAYTNETTHFGFPLPLGTDLTVPMDYNESLEEADTALFEAQTNAAGAVGTAGNALTVANEAKTEAQSATATANSATATANAAATAANEAVAAVAEAKDDALDMICAVVEETATAQYKHEPTRDGLNYYFRYNDILYKTTAVINVGETIVPNTNCAATNVATELEAIQADTPTAPVSVTADGVKTWSTLLNELYALMDTTKITAKSYLTITTSGNTVILNINTIGPFYRFVQIYRDADTYTVSGVDIRLRNTGSTRYTNSDESDTVATSGIVISLNY